MKRLLVVLLATIAASVCQAVVYFSIVERDYTNNLTATDSDWFYLDAYGDTQDPVVGQGYYPSLEYEAGRGFQIGDVVYTKSSSIQITLKFKNMHPNTITANLAFSAFRIAVPPGPNRPSTTYLNLTPPSSQQFTCSGSGGTATVTISVTGVPSYVTLGQLQWQGTLTAVSGITPGTNLWAAPLGWGTWEDMYFVDASPVGLQGVPWTDLLAWTCSWAHGESGTSDVADALTFGIYWDTPWVYDPSNVYYTYYDPAFLDAFDSDEFGFALKDALGAEYLNVDCRDQSNLLQLSFATQGISGGTRILEATDGLDIFGFITNIACGVGNDATSLMNYEVFEFAFHQVLVLSSSVYDGVAAQWTDLSGASYANPPMGWNLSNYWQTSDGSGGFYGLTNSFYPNSLPEAVGFTSTPNNLVEIR